MYNTRHKKLWQNQYTVCMYTANVNSLLMNLIFNFLHPFLSTIHKNSQESLPLWEFKLRTMITQWVFIQTVLKISITFVIFFSFSLFQLEGWWNFIETVQSDHPMGPFVVLKLKSRFVILQAITC